MLTTCGEAWEGAYQVESLTPVGPWPSGAGGGPVYMRPAPTLRPGAGGTGPVHPRRVGFRGPHAAGGTVKARGEGLEARSPPPVRKLPRKRVSMLISGELTFWEWSFSEIRSVLGGYPFHYPSGG